MNIDLQQLIKNVKSEADRLQADDLSLSTFEAYQQAWILMIMAAAEEPTVTPFESTLLSAIREMHKRTPHAIGFKRRDILRQLDLRGMEIDEWTLSRTLNSLEARGVVCRPRGGRSHYWAARMAA